MIFLLFIYFQKMTKTLILNSSLNNSVLLKYLPGKDFKVRFSPDLPAVLVFLEI